MRAGPFSAVLAIATFAAASVLAQDAGVSTITCNGAVCAAGQVCVDFSAAGDGSDQKCSCSPKTSTTADSCAALGKVCGMDDLDPKPSTCRLPLEFETCTASVGCDTPSELDCYKFTSSSICLRKCTNSNGAADTSMCVEPYTVCVGALAKHCYFNICADPNCAAGTASCSATTERSFYFKPCTSINKDDSTCVQITWSDGTEIGLCMQGGSVATGGTCNPEANRSGNPPYAGMCGVGDYCMPDSTGTTGVCEKICNAYTDASPAPIPANMGCPAGQTCEDVTGAPATVKQTRMGLCEGGLTADAGTPAVDAGTPEPVADAGKAPGGKDAGHSSASESGGCSSASGTGATFAAMLAVGGLLVAFRLRRRD